MAPDTFDIASEEEMVLRSIQPTSRARALVGPGSPRLSARKSKEIIFGREYRDAMAPENIRCCAGGVLVGYYGYYNAGGEVAC